MARSAIGGELEEFSVDPMAGFFRDGCCTTGSGDTGLHAVGAAMTDEFLRFSKAHGNDLSTRTPSGAFRPEAGRPLVPARCALAGGLRAGDGTPGGVRGNPRAFDRVVRSAGPDRLCDRRREHLLAWFASLLTTRDGGSMPRLEAERLLGEQLERLGGRKLSRQERSSGALFAVECLCRMTAAT